MPLLTEGMERSRYYLKPLPNDGTRLPRVEIDEFIADNDMTNLFLLALSAMMKESLKEIPMKQKDSNEVKLEPDWLNYYSLSGIHWLPNESWDDVPNEKGYCHHGKPTFPTWHRPYMNLYEWAVHEQMVAQAKKFPGEAKAKYLAAAARFRLPYWDPIMPRRVREVDDAYNAVWGSPEILKAEKVYLLTPEKPDEFTKVDNPLYSFRFPDSKEWAQDRNVKRVQLPQPGYNEQRTARRPRYTMGRRSDNEFLDVTIQRQASDLATLIWQMLHPDSLSSAGSKDADGNDVVAQSEKKLNALRSWNSFSNHNVTVVKDKDNQLFYPTVSLEHWHDLIHDLVGQGENAPGVRDNKDFKDEKPNVFDPLFASMGQMGDPKYAGFEPIFWLHHCNVDRLLSLFQALYPDTYAEALRSADNMDADLLPFRKNANQFYKSADPLVSDYWAPGFAVPGDKKVEGKNVSHEVQKYLTQTYWWAANNDPTGRSGSLVGWPKTKNVDGCQALWGRNAYKSETTATIGALSTVDGVAQLIERKFTFEAGIPPVDNIIKMATVMESAAKIGGDLPDGALLNSDMMQTWNALVSVRKFAFNGPFSIHLFLGDVEEGLPMLFLTKKNEVSFLSVFTASGDTEACANCEDQRADDTLYEGVIPLTTKLVEYLERNRLSKDLIKNGQHRTIRNLEPDAVVPFLREQLTWRMIDLASAPLSDPENKAKLEITVASRKMEPPSKELPMGSYGPMTPYLVANATGRFQDMNTFL